MTTSRWLASCLFLVQVAVCCNLMATLPCPSRPASKAEARDLASQWFATGAERVAAGDFSGGRHAFLCSHAMVPHPASLLNAALASHRANDVSDACALYQRFLDTSDDDRKNAKVRIEMASLKCDDASAATTFKKRRIDNTYPNVTEDSPRNDTSQSEPDNLKNRDAKHREAIKPPAPEVIPEPNSTLLITRTPYQLQSPLRKSGNILLISGTSVLVAGTAFQLMAAWNKHEGDVTTNAKLFDVYDKNTDRYQYIANIGFISGSVLFLTGLTLRIASHKMPLTETNITASRILPWHSGVLFTHTF
ncbi:MAG: hypothetical protein JXX14_11240 [Deltaproteobacteria bacterium]|nr:hypothetical protein [Deltaproteobacteria bacterium]